jgi:hypothetical protein
MAIVNQDTAGVYGNTLSATVISPQIVKGPQIAPVKNPAYALDGLQLTWDDMTKVIVVDVATDGQFANIITSATSGVNTPLTLMLSPGTYWIRGRWQSVNITPPNYSNTGVVVSSKDEGK